MGADDRDCARPDDHVLQCRLSAGCVGRDGEKLRRAADDGRDRDRGLFHAGCRLRHAGRKTRPAVRRVAGVPFRRHPVLRIPDTDDVQPDGHADDISAGALRRGGRRHRAVAGGADRRELHGTATGDGRRRARFRACSRRRAGVYYRRRAGHLYRLAPGIRNPDRRFRHRFPVEFPSQARLRPPGCEDRYLRSSLLRRQRSFSSASASTI